MSRPEAECSRAVLIDLDGTLVDSLPALKYVYQSFLAERGCVGSRDEFERLNGLSLLEIVAQLAHTHALEHGRDELYQRYLALVRDAYIDVTPCGGAERLLQWLRVRQVTTALVTTNVGAVVEPFLIAKGWQPFFDAVVTSDEVQKGKPDPEIFNLAIRRLAVPKSRAAVIEDSVNGVRAACAAGLCAIAVLTPSAGGPEDTRRRLAAGAWRVVPDLEVAVQVLDEWLEIP